MSGGILSWVIERRAVWRVELRGGAWDASFGGKGEMLEPLSLWGEVWLFWAGGGDEAWEGGFVLSAYFVGGDFGA
jgi:hypothetical protein